MAAKAVGIFGLLPCFLSCAINCLELDVNNTNSIRAAARTVADGIFHYYKNNASDTDPEHVGLFPFPPYYWWESGATWAAMVDYYTYTGDSSYVEVTMEALLAQKGPDNNFIVPAHRFDEGNDDQAFWGLGIISALENRWPEPHASEQDWLSLLTALFENQTERWDTSSCGGGLKWQIYPENSYGYDYKNSVSNGAYFQLAARLARYTGDAKYVHLATRVWNWCESVGLISPSYDVFDGTNDKLNCTQLDHTQWTYNTAIFLEGAAALWNFTNDPVWTRRVDGLLAALTSNFFSPFANATNVMFESACETAGTCNIDQYSFKAFMSRWLAKTMVLAPWTHDHILPLLQASAVAAAQSCSGGINGVTCGHKWYLRGWDGTSGLGQQLSALETIQSLLVFQNNGPYSLVVEENGAPPITRLPENDTVCIL
ncbi:uncharacterized protein PV09_06502 [Verruconis gallopava]|uniref:Mannan endo-1,6-alpha-mannosidase n=1 Tax=Verruconis gallopava TaxID=253628 RepID=A0A0D1YMK3_9PEZI|nr:uncharacterized protein PV09_06502 [Verruconis gallopava]KIW01992.1 hypothetical protein PV09_06502 [Verruconis gallopava]